MKLIEKNINVMTMKYPASWHGALWREGLLGGNGKIGVNVYGGTMRETVIINHAELWGGTAVQKLPDVSDCLAKTRAAMDAECFNEASWILANALKEKEYDNVRGYPLPLAEMNMIFTGLPGYSDYLRAINMETGEISSQFKEKNAWIKKDLFVSRKDDMIILSIKAETPILNVSFALDMRRDNAGDADIRKYVENNRKIKVIDNILTYQSVDTDRLPYGAAAKVESADGDISVADHVINIRNASEILVKIKVFVKGGSTIDAVVEELKGEDGNYEYYLNRHLPLHRSLYNSADLRLAESSNLSNEELLLEAYSGRSSNELVEKLWRFGRYLFICGSSSDGLPFGMFGIWQGEYQQMWSHNMANENIQMIYWHTNVGNLGELNKPFFDYYSSRINCFKENAKRLYGCSGIFIPAGTTPNMPFPNQIVPVILNWTGAAGWLAQHYYRHYLYTGDTVYLQNVLLPFMKEVIDFYEDFIVYDDNGRIKMYPSISPENTPLNFIPEGSGNLAHPMPTAINATMDLAIIKEVFSNMIRLSEQYDLYSEKLDDWKRIVKAVPEYKANGDGVVKEWQDEHFEDRYYHRHLSHIYPVFPGEEITTQDSIISIFEKAVDLRDIGAQTGWSLAHMASIYARLERGNDALQCLNNIERTCMQQNLVTLHNDWRRMDISLEMDMGAPIQFDAVLGYVNAVQEMILYSSEKLVKLLPALPDIMTKGRIKNWRFVGGSINMEWDMDKGMFTAELEADRTVAIDIKLPPGYDNLNWSGDCVAGRKGNLLSVRMKNNSRLHIFQNS